MSKLSDFSQALEKFNYKSLLTPKKIFILISAVFLIGVLAGFFLMRTTDFASETAVRGYFEGLGIVPEAESKSKTEGQIDKENEEEGANGDEQQEDENTDQNEDGNDSDTGDDEEEATAWDEDAVDDDLGHTESEEVSRPDVKYPTIQTVTDGIGHTQTGSMARGNTGEWQYQTIQEGNTLRFTVTSDNPNSLTLLYRFEYQAPNSSFKLVRTWGTSKTVVWTVPASAVGKWSYIKVMVKDSDAELRFGNCDDYTLLTYTVDPAVDPTTLYPWLIQVSDSKGSINTNSWGGDNSGDWSDGLPHTLTVGETVTFTASASDPNGDALKYRLMYQPEGGSFITLRSWGTGKTFSWTVPANLVDTYIVFYVGVKDSDTYIQFGEDDDYTYMSYSVVAAE